MVMWMFAFMFGLTIGVIFCSVIRDGLASIGGFFTYMKDSYASSKVESVNP